MNGRETSRTQSHRCRLFSNSLSLSALGLKGMVHLKDSSSEIFLDTTCYLRGQIGSLPTMSSMYLAGELHTSS